jgi:hypothetical protein
MLVYLDVSLPFSPFSSNYIETGKIYGISTVYDTWNECFNIFYDLCSELFGLR